MDRKISRRVIVKNGLIASALLPFLGLLSRIAVAAGLPALDPADPTAKSLGFLTDASKATAAKPGQKCATCAQFQGKAGDESAAVIFSRARVSPPPVGAWFGRRKPEAGCSARAARQRNALALTRFTATAVQ